MFLDLVISDFCVESFLELLVEELVLRRMERVVSVPFKVRLLKVRTNQGRVGRSLRHRLFNVFFLAALRALAPITRIKFGQILAREPLPDPAIVKV